MCGCTVYVLSNLGLLRGDGHVVRLPAAAVLGGIREDLDKVPTLAISTGVAHHVELLAADADLLAGVGVRPLRVDTGCCGDSNY